MADEFLAGVWPSQSPQTDGLPTPAHPQEKAETEFERKVRLGRLVSQSMSPLRFHLQLLLYRSAGHLVSAAQRLEQRS